MAGSKVVPINPQVRDIKEFFESIAGDAEAIEGFAIVVRVKDEYLDDPEAADTNVYFSPMTCGEGAWLDFVFREAFMKTLLESD